MKNRSEITAKINFKRLICCFFLFVLFSQEPCFSKETSGRPVKDLGVVTLQLKWKHQFQFAGYYAALEKGFYRKAGLDVKILEAEEGLESVVQVMKGEADFGVAMSDLILHRAKGQPVVALASIFQHSPLIILTSKTSGIENIHGLKGKRIALERHAAELLAYLEYEGLPLKQLEIVPHGFSVSKLISGEADAISAYSTDEPFVLLNQGIGYNVFSPRAGGIDFYGDTLFTSEKKVKKAPEVVDAFLAASLEGWQYALDNTEEIIDLILSRYTRRHSREHLLFEAQKSKNLIMADVVELGYMNAGRWEYIKGTYEKSGMIDPDFSLDGFVYSPHPEIDYTWVKWAVGAMAGTALLVGIAALFLLFFNKKLKAEIGERKKIQTALKDSEEKYKAMFNNAQVALFRNGIVDGKLLEINERYAKMAGYATIGECMAEFNAADAWADAKGRKELLEILAKDGFVLDYETKIIRRDGILIWISFSATIFSEKGYLEGSIVDITHRKRAEASLRKSQATLKAALESMTDAVSISDDQGQVVEFNEAFATYHRFGNKDECLKRLEADPDILEVFLPDGTPAPMGMWATSRALGGETAINSEYTLRRKDTGESWVGSYNFAPIRDKEGMIVGSVVVGRDITDQKRAAEEKEKLEGQLLQAQKLESIGTLAGGIAHDFNNILYPIIGFTEMSIEDLPENHPVQENLQDILKGTKRARDLVKQILSFSNQRDLKQKALSLRPLIEETFRLLKSIIPSNIKIEQDLSQEDICVFANTTEIHEIIMNLCTNAYHAMEGKGGTLKVGLYMDHTCPAINAPLGEYCCLCISDTGSGISPAIRENIFDPYFTTKEQGKGSGLGLSVIHGIVKSYKGVIEVESEPGKGTRFNVFLPVTSKREIKTAKTNAGATKSGNERILFVDDEEAIVKLGVRMLQRLGYTVVGETSSIDAMELFKSAPDSFDLIITDMTMPLLLGTQLAQKILEIRQEIPILICTGFSEQLDTETAASYGIKGYINKPILMGELSSKVRELLDLKPM